MITPQPMPPNPQQAPKLLDQVRDKIRLKHYSIRTEQAYVDWIKRFVLFHHKRHPRNGRGGSGGVFDASGGGREGCGFNAKSGKGGGVIFISASFKSRITLAGKC